MIKQIFDDLWSQNLKVSALDAIWAARGAILEALSAYPMQLAYFWFRLGQAELDHHRWKNAYRAFSACLEIHFPMDPDIYAMLETKLAFAAHETYWFELAIGIMSVR